MNGEVTTMPELPKGWVWTTVGEIYDIVGGGTPSTAVAEYWEGDIPWITSADIFGLRDIRPRRQITSQAIEGSATHLVPAGSLIIVTRVGLGKIALTSIPICFSQDSQALVCGNVSLFPDYSLYCLSEVIQVFKYKHRGTTINGVTKRQLAELTFPVPPLSEQHRVVAKIEELFTRLNAGVEALKKIKVQLKRYRQAVLKHAFEGKLTEEWRQAHKHELEPASVLLDRIKQERQKTAKGKYKEISPPDTSALPPLPEGWMWTKSGTLSWFVTSGSRDWRKYYSDHGALFIRTQDINKNKLSLDNAAHVCLPEQVEGKRALVDENDILIIITGANVGKVALVDKSTGEAYVSQSIALMKLVMPKMARFVHLAMVADGFGKSQLQKFVYGMGRPVLSLENVQDIILPISGVSEQHQIIAEVERRFSVADEIEKTLDHSLKQAERLRQSILKRAFEGKLVPQDSNDEPAEKLIERIEAERTKRLAEAKAASKNKKSTHTKQVRLM